MKTFLILFISAIGVATIPAHADKPTAAEAKTKATAWIDALPKEGLVLNEKRAPGPDRDFSPGWCYSASTIISGWSFSTCWPWSTRILTMRQSVEALISL